MHGSCPHPINVNLGLCRQQFLHHLTASTAWHAGARTNIGLGINAAHGQFQRSFALTDGREQGDALCADAQPITGVFHIAAVDHAAVSTAHGGPHIFSKHLEARRGRGTRLAPPPL